MKLNKEEKTILEAYDKGSLKLRAPTKKDLVHIKSAAEKTFTKDKRVTLRLYDHDYKGIQKKAMEMGVPYQTLISGIIHSYVEGDLIKKIG